MDREREKACPGIRERVKGMSGMNNDNSNKITIDFESIRTFVDESIENWVEMGRPSEDIPELKKIIKGVSKSVDLFYFLGAIDNVTTENVEQHLSILDDVHSWSFFKIREIETLAIKSENE